MIELISINDRLKCVFMDRINRFVVKVKINDREDYAHINNTGRLKSLFVPGFISFCMPINGRKLKYRLFAMGDSYNKSFSVIDTSLHMRAFEKIVEKKLIDEVKDFDFRRNPRFGNSVFDYLLFNKKEKIVVEIKSAVMLENGFSMYPDAPTRRGIRHFQELIKLRKDGLKTMIVFVSSVPNVKGFRANGKISSEIPELLIEAKREGVIIKSFNILFSSESSVIFLETLDLPVFYKYF